MPIAALRDPSKTRGRALSLHRTGVFAGAPAGSVIADHMGWRAS